MRQTLVRTAMLFCAFEFALDAVAQTHAPPAEPNAPQMNVSVTLSPGAGTRYMAVTFILPDAPSLVPLGSTYTYMDVYGYQFANGQRSNDTFFTRISGAWVP